MTVVPLPASPCVRVRLDYTETDNFLAGSRFYLSYSGAAPTAGNCTTLASDIAAAWASHLAAIVTEKFVLTEVDVLDITSETGASGQWAGTDAGTMTGDSLPAAVANNIEFGIARRYRGGKPRMFLPPPDNTAQEDAGHWTSSFVTTSNAAVLAFFTEIEALAIGSVGTLAHVNLSYYKGFTNISNSSGRERAVPTYRDAALVDSVESYITKLQMGSQRRRRSAITY